MSTQLPRLQSPVTPLRPQDDFGNLDATANAPIVPDAWEASNARLAREKSATTSDYIGSMWRQDGLVDGFTAHLAGSQMAPDPGFNPFTDKSLPELQRGLWPEFSSELYKATSAGHATYLRGLLLQKQEDLTRLGDMGVAGNVARFGFNAVLPDQLLIGMAGGWATRGVLAVESARAMRLAKNASGLAKAEASAGVAAAQTARASTKSAVAFGIGTGAVENAAYEQLRQSVNFEHDGGQVFEAALMGAAITAPFALSGARGAARSARIAEQELDTLRALRAVDEGKDLTPVQARRLDEMHKAHRVVAEMEAGRLTPEQADKALTEFHGPEEPVHSWLDRYGDRLRAETEDFIATNYPNAKGRATGRPAPSAAAKARMDRAVDLEAKTHFPEEDATGNPQLEGQMAQAFRKAIMEREKAAKPGDLSALDALTQNARKAERAAAHTHAEWSRQLAADQERMVRAHDLVLAEQDPFHIEQPPRTAETATPTPEAQPYQAESYTGQEVSWADEHGNTVEGTVLRFNPELDKLIVETLDGMRAVRVEHLDQYAGTSPAGFGGQSVGAAQVKGTQIDTAATQRTAKAAVRLDYFAVLNGSPLQSVRALASRLIKDALQTDKFDAQAMTASEWKSHFQKTIGGAFQVEARAAARDAISALGVPLWKQGEFTVQFHRLVTESTYDPNILGVVPEELRPHVQRASAAMKAAYAKTLKAMQDAGVKGADQIAPDEFYTNRVWHHGNLRKVADKYGEDAVIDLVASAIKDKKGVVERMRKAPGTEEVRDTLTNKVLHEGKTDAELLRKKAEGFLRTVKALEFSPALREVALAGRDMGTLRGELRSLGVADSHIDDLVDLMFEVRPGDADGGRIANLKYRFQLDHSAELMTPGGTVRLSDLFEMDARVLVQSYLNGSAGHIGLAKHGITSQADWLREVKAIEEEGKASLGSDGARIASDMKHLQDIHKTLTGRPHSEASFSVAARTANAVRAYTRAVMLPQLGIAAAFEMGKSISMFGFGAMLRQMPSLRGFLRAIRQGHLPDEGLSQQIRLMTGFGNEMASSFARGQEIESGFFGQALTRVEDGANRVSHMADVLSGNASFTSMSKQLSAQMVVQQFSNHAHGKALSAKKVERWVGQGINADDLPDVMAAFKKHTERGEGGTVTGIDYEAWHAADPRTYEQFQTFLTRQVRDAIQDHDLGETMPFMHTQLGKVFAELKTFFLVGHAKNFLKQLHFHDATALQVWGIGFVSEALAYMTQTAVNYPTELDKRLTPDKIATAAYFRMSSLGTASLLTEFGYNVATGGESLMSPGMTANTDNRSFLKSPSLIVINRLTSLPSTLGGMALGTDTTTSREARDVVGSVPLLRLYGLSAAAQYWANGFPAKDPEKFYGH